MVSIVIKREQQGRFTEFTCSGHAGFSEIGSDIVCSGISTLTHTAVLALDKLANIEVVIQADAETGYLNCKWDPQVNSVTVGTIIAMMHLGLIEIQKQYPDYLQVSEVEV